MDELDRLAPLAFIARAIDRLNRDEAGLFERKHERPIMPKIGEVPFARGDEIEHALFSLKRRLLGLADKDEIGKLRRRCIIIVARLKIDAQRTGLRFVEAHDFGDAAAALLLVEAKIARHDERWALGRRLVDELSDRDRLRAESRNRDLRANIQ